MKYGIVCVSEFAVNWCIEGNPVLVYDEDVNQEECGIIFVSVAEDLISWWNKAKSNVM